MTKEQEKETIKYLEFLQKEFLEDAKRRKENGEITGYGTMEDIDKLRALHIGFALDMLKENSAEIEQKNTELAEKNAEIEKFKQVLARNIARNVTSSMKESAKSKEDLEMLNAGWQIELEKKDKIIDLMAEEMNQNYFNIFSSNENNKIRNIYEKIKNTSKLIGLNLRKECIKQYFERKAKEI